MSPSLAALSTPRGLGPIAALAMLHTLAACGARDGDGAGESKDGESKEGESKEGGAGRGGARALEEVVLHGRAREYQASACGDGAEGRVLLRRDVLNKLDRRPLAGSSGRLKSTDSDMFFNVFQ